MIVTITLLLLFDSDDVANFSDIVRVTWHYIGVRSLLKYLGWWSGTINLLLFLHILIFLFLWTFNW